MATDFDDFVTTGVATSKPPTGQGTLTNETYPVFTYVTGATVTTVSSMSANTWEEVVNLTSTQGFITCCAVRAPDVTSRTIDIRLTLDGNVLTSASQATTAAGRGVFLFPSFASGVNTSSFSGSALQLSNETLVFDSSMKIEVRSTVASDAVDAIYKYWTV